MSYVPAVLEIRTLDASGNQVVLVDLLNNGNGTLLKNWRPKRAQMKGGGVFQDSPFANGRQLVQAVYDNVTEALTLTMVNDAPDSTFYHDSELTRALQDAMAYSINGFGYPVFLAMQPRGASNEQYALISNGRTEEFEDPFSSVAYQFWAPRSIADEIPLVIEREQWLEAPPTTGVALPLSAVQAYPESFALSFANDDDAVDCGSDASIDNLPSGGQITVEAYVRFDKQKTRLQSIINKQAWDIRVQAGQLWGVVSAATQPAFSVVPTSAFSADGLWHHVAMTYDDTGTRLVRVFIDGAEPAYTSQTAASGSYIADAPFNLGIGNRILSPTRAWFGLIGWCRVSDNLRYTGSFTPPSRCSPPAIDGNTAAQWNMQEGTGTTVDNAEGTSASDGTITGAIWSSARENGVSCGVRNYGNVDSSGDRQTTTDNEVYIGNKHTMAQITNIHIGTAGANLIDSSWPANIHAVTSASATYFGIASSSPNSGPFDSLVFDIGTAQVGATLVWEYWNGSVWTGLTVTDNTDSFQNTGVNSIHWIAPSNWTAASPGGSIPSGYYVRVRTTVTGSTNPQQQNRNPYTICWPFVEIQAADVPGEIEALARLKLYGQSGKSSSLEAPQRVYLALRSVARGEDFSPFINLADTQQIPGVTVENFSGSTSFTNDLLAPAGRSLAVATTFGSTYCARVTFSRTITKQYHGRFRVFLRHHFNGAGTTYDLSLIFNSDLNYYINGIFHQTDTLTTNQNYNELSLMSFGVVNIPEYIDEFSIQIHQVRSNSTRQLSLVDIVLFPIDEWIAVYKDPTDYAAIYGYPITAHLISDYSSSVLSRHYLDIDKINNKNASGTLVKVDGEIGRLVFDEQAGNVFFQKNSRQRIWFFQTGQPGQSDSFTISRPFNSLSVQAFRNSQYLGIRGNR